RRVPAERRESGEGCDESVATQAFAPSAHARVQLLETEVEAESRPVDIGEDPSGLLWLRGLRATVPLGGVRHGLADLPRPPCQVRADPADHLPVHAGSPDDLAEIEAPVERIDGHPVRQFRLEDLYAPRPRPHPAQ